MTARMLHESALLMIAVVIVLVVAMTAFAPANAARWIAVGVALDAGWALQIVLARRGRLVLAGAGSSLLVWSALTFTAWTAGGVSAPSIAAQVAVVMYAGMVLGWRAGLAAGAISTMTVFALAWAEVVHVLPASTVAHTPWSRAMSVVLYVVGLACLQAIVMRTLGQARADSVREVAERLAAEEEVRRLNADLEKRVEQRTADLEATVEQLEATNRKLDEATRAKSDFLASMSHELRTPLNSIIGFSGVMAQGMSGELSAEQARQARMISNSGRRLLALVNQVLDLSKIEAGQEHHEARTFDLVQCASDVVECLGPQWRERSLDVEVRATETVMVTSDPELVERILTNLIANAVRYTDAGSVTVSVSSDGRTASVDVIDTGCGISEADLGHVFEDFYQSSPPDGGKHEGTGLGLSIASRLAAMLGGSISVASQVAVGSTFTLSLPLAIGAARDGGS